MEAFYFIEKAIELAEENKGLNVICESNNSIGFRYISDIKSITDKYGKSIVLVIGSEPNNIYSFLNLFCIEYNKLGRCDVQLLSEDGSHYLDVKDVGIFEKYGNKYYIIK
jgi:hypothetical protein